MPDFVQLGLQCHTPNTVNLNVTSCSLTSAVDAGLVVFTRGATYHALGPKHTNSAPSAINEACNCLYGPSE